MNEELELACMVPESDLEALFAAAEGSRYAMVEEDRKQRSDWQLCKTLAVRTQKEVAEMLGISPQMVSLYEKSALRKLRVALADLRP